MYEAWQRADLRQVHKVQWHCMWPAPLDCEWQMQCMTDPGGGSKSEGAAHGTTCHDTSAAGQPDPVPGKWLVVTLYVFWHWSNTHGLSASPTRTKLQAGILSAPREWKQRGSSASSSHSYVALVRRIAAALSHHVLQTKLYTWQLDSFGRNKSKQYLGTYIWFVPFVVVQ